MLTEKEAHHIEKHLEECAACRRQAQEMRRLRNDLVEFGVPPLPAYLVHKVLRKYQALQQQPSFWNSFDFFTKILRPVTLVLAIAGFLVLWFYPPAPDPLVSEAARKYTLIFESTPGDSILSTDDQALNFALNMRPATTTGENK